MVSHQDLQSNSSSDRYSTLAAAARDTGRVEGLTHTFYRYPARFSPQFVRAAILEFTKPGDWVFDPFMGGGTSLVEAIALGRNAFGSDISTLAKFVTEAKLLCLHDSDAMEVLDWVAELEFAINMRLPSKSDEFFLEAGYHRNLNGNEHWRLRKAIEQSLSSIELIDGEAGQKLARCAVLRTAQWAIDGRKTAAHMDEYKLKLSEFAGEMVESSLKFSREVRKLQSGGGGRHFSYLTSAEKLDPQALLENHPSPKLIVTSPPYPGVHVLYHRWQVNGGRETPAPFWIANQLDGSGESYYTMGGRGSAGIKTYFEKLRANFSAIAKVANSRTKIVQVVAFSDPEAQLPLYLSTMEECGLEEMQPWQIADTNEDGRVWRHVPNRKWHAQQRTTARGSVEVVLMHKLRTQKY